MDTSLGKDIIRKEAWQKVTGKAKYTNDIKAAPMLHAKLLVSPHAHANIVSIDVAEAKCMRGVKAVITANDVNVICGSFLRDRLPLAKEKVRYFGEPIAIVVANNEEQAQEAISKIKIEYSVLPVVNSIQDSIKPNPVLIHENLRNYKKIVKDVYPIANTNICHQHKVRKGDMQSGWNESEIIVEGKFKLPQSDHAAQETRVARCTILPDGRVIIKASSQAPFDIKKLVSEYFNIAEGNVIVNVPFVGGGFGGKAAIQLEVLAVLASMAVGGEWVNLVNSREQDMVTSPCHIGLEANIRIGAKKNGQIMAAQMIYYIDSGAYAEISPKIAKAIVVDCCGPYNMPNILCDCYAVYTNHTYVTSFRGFGHTSLSFCLERMMDKLALKLNLDPIQIRIINSLKEGHFTPTGVKVTNSNTGDFVKCLEKLKDVINWNEGTKMIEDNNIIRVKGIGCFNKTSDTPTDAAASAIINFNSDGSVNIDVGAVEIGPGMKTTMAQILAEKLKMDVNRIFVKMEVDTETTPIFWKTVASMTTFMVGRSVLNAVDDVIAQIKNVGSVILRSPTENLEVANEKVYLKNDPSVYISFKDIVQGYKYENGNSIIGPIIGRGSYIMDGLTILDEQTGQGKAGLSWTLGAQAVELEYDTIQHTYRILKAATVIDVGKVLNPKTAKGVIMGGMCMGLGLGTSEEFVYDVNAIPQNTSFRTFKMIRYGETPDYLVEFIETPQIDAPFGARGLAEHGIIGMTACLGNALSLATGIDICQIPITPEYIWRNLNNGSV